MSEQLTDTDFVRVCRLDELPLVGATLAEVNGRRVSLVRTEDGGLHCIDDACTHGNVSLSEGELDGCMIECWLHGSRFDLRTGKPSGPPAVTAVPVYRISVAGTGDDAVVLVDTAARPL